MHMIIETSSVFTVNPGRSTYLAHRNSGQEEVWEFESPDRNVDKGFGVVNLMNTWQCIV